MNFKVGDRVRCIDDYAAFGLLLKGETYTVLAVSGTGTNSRVCLKETGTDRDWFPYRFELVKEEPVKTPHKHAELIKAWADGAQIQYKRGNKWVPTCGAPAWSAGLEYRIKPEPKPDVVKECFAISTNQNKAGVGLTSQEVYGFSSNVRFTFDGETGQLKAVELIK